MRLERSLVAIIVAVGSIFLLPSAAAADEATIIFQANLRIPIAGTTALGTLTTTVDEDTGEGAWSFQGTINGQFATASGGGICTIDGSTINLAMTSIDNWQMPGLAPPPLPAKGTVRSLGNLAYISYGPAVGIPVSVSPAINVPIQSGTYVLTEPGKGAEGVDELPNTGVAPMVGESGSGSASSILFAPFSVILVLLAIAFIILAGGRWQRRQRHDQVPKTEIQPFSSAR